MKPSTLAQLWTVFAPLSLLTLGGGQSILADIQREAVTVHHWLTAQQFLDDFAISRASAGPNTLIVTLVGWQVAGIAGAAVTSLAIFLPSSLLFFGLSHLWRRPGFTRWRLRLERGLAPLSVGLVLASTWSVLATQGGGWLAWVVSAATCLVLLFTRVPPVLLLSGGAAIFLLGYR